MKFDIYFYTGDFGIFGKISEIIPEFFESKLVNFKLGQQHLQKDLVNESLKIKLQKCENVGRNLAECLNTERCKSVLRPEHACQKRFPW